MLNMFCDAIEVGMVCLNLASDEIPASNIFAVVLSTCTDGNGWFTNAGTDKMASITGTIVKTMTKGQKDKYKH